MVDLNSFLFSILAPIKPMADLAIPSLYARLPQLIVMTLSIALLGNQMVLLKQVNDNVETVKKLNHKLLMVGIKPYYIYLCDKAKGNYHFRTTLETGLDIMSKLNVWTSGHAVPQLIKDIEGGGGKIPLNPNYITDIQTDKNGKKIYTLQNYRGELFPFKDV